MHAAANSRWRRSGESGEHFQPTGAEPHTASQSSKRARCSKPQAVIATGARAFVPPIPGLDEIEFLTNENVFDLPRIEGAIAEKNHQEDYKSLLWKSTLLFFGSFLPRALGAA